MMENTAFSSPRPTPQFFAEPKTFSTKKSRGTPRDSLPPRPPIKSAPPISRIFPHRPVQRAQIVSFRSSDSNGSFLIPSCSGNSRELYFNQGFEVISKLGAGSFGEVFKVCSREDGQLYAIKKSRDRFRGESDRRRKLEEVAKQEKLPFHPNCVRFYRAWEERQQLYLQVELCKTSLSNFSENCHDIPEMLIWNYLVDLLMAVKHLHDNNLIHMDIKPDNIFISFDGVCKLGDFGLVIDLTKSIDFSEAQEGDPKYLAPELMNGKFGKPADVFSLGMTILELASDLDLPRGGEGWHLLRSGQVPEEFLRDKSFDLKYVIKQMLDPDPTSRPTVDQVLAFPYVRKVWKRRRREYMLKSARVMTRRSGRHPSTHSDSSHNHSRSSGSAGLDHSISDDECFEYDHDISINNNSIAAPLDSSTGDSFEEEEFLCKPPLRNAFTSPAIRHRHFNHIPSPMSSSPVQHQSQRKPSPNSSFNSTISFEEDRSLTPTFNNSAHVDPEEGTTTKPGIEPKNLMGMFEAASDDED